MSIADYNLRPEASYDVRVAFALERFRAQLRKERESRVGGREKLAEKAGVNKTTIQNIESGPDMPGIDTVAKLIEAMPGLTLSEFFLHIEEGSKPATVSAPSGRADASADSLVAKGLSDADTLIRLGRTLLYAGDRMRESEKARRTTRRHRPPPSKGPQRRAG